MVEYKKYFQNKKVTKQGFGVLGRGVGATKFLLYCGAKVLVTDNKPAELFIDQVEEVKVFCVENGIPPENVEYIFGEHRLQDFEDTDFVVQASGVAKDNTFLKHARDKNISVYQEGSLFCDIIRNNNKTKIANIKIIGITGTRGKTTTTTLIFNVLRKNFGQDRVHLGGNIQGVSTLDLLLKIKEGDYVVLELDSWVLQGFKDIVFSPDLSVFTNFMPDHMNYYKGDMKEYFYDKANIFLYQNSDSSVIMDDKVYAQSKIYLDNNDFSKLKPILIGNYEFKKIKEKIGEIYMVGDHNIHNSVLTYRACQVLGVPEEEIIGTVKSFSGVAGRLEKRLVFEGVTYYNDTCATTGEAASAAISAFKGLCSLILITGGRDKDLDTDFYAQNIINAYKAHEIKNIILLSDDTTNGTESLIKYFDSIKFIDYKCAPSIREAVLEASKMALSGDIVLFSPGFASFGMFDNEYHRGEMYNKALGNLKNK